MLLERFHDAALAQASYLVGCAATREALVVDPNRDVEQYVRAAARERLRITHVADTHLHADFVSGARELAHRTGATLLLSDSGDADSKYLFPTAEERASGTRVVPLRDGDAFAVGSVHVDVVATPGPTPEHLCFLVTDTAAADRPMGAFTGDFILAGDVGCPEPPEGADDRGAALEAGARTLFRSLRRFGRYPDWLQIWPGHGAGFAGAAAVSAVPMTTLGYEKAFNRALAAADEEAFARLVLDGRHEPPGYFARVRRINREGPRLLGAFRRPPHQDDGTRLAAVLAAGDTVIDVRPAADFAARHVPGTVNIPLNRSFAGWAGTLVPYDADVHLLAPDGEAVDRAVRELAMIGLDRLCGHFTPDALSGWVASGRALGSVPQIAAADVAARVAQGALHDGTLAVIDVRAPGSWRAGHIPGVPNVPVERLAAHLDQLPRDRPIVLHCGSGGRSAIAASLLRARGFDNAMNMSGGYRAWRDAGNPVTREDAELPPAAPTATEPAT